MADWNATIHDCLRHDLVFQLGLGLTNQMANRICCGRLFLSILNLYLKSHTSIDSRFYLVLTIGSKLICKRHSKHREKCLCWWCVVCHLIINRLQGNSRSRKQKCCKITSGHWYAKPVRGSDRTCAPKHTHTMWWFINNDSQSSSTCWKLC